MASTLCLKTRNDIRMASGIADPMPIEAQEAKPNAQIVDLVNLMRATCLDVAESAVNSDIQLANSTICVARALKINASLKVEQREMEGVPTSLAQATWGKLLKYVEDPFEFTWLSAQDCSLQALMRLGPFEYSQAELTMLSDDLYRRSRPSLPIGLGTLLDYQVTLFEVGRYYYRRHTYLFETAVVVMGDGDHGFTTISMNGSHHHPLELFRLIKVCEIVAVDPMQRSGGGIGYIYGLKFKERGEGSNLTLGFDDLPAATDWLIKIRHSLGRDSPGILDTGETQEVAVFESFAVIMQTFKWQLPVSEPLGPVLCHGIVTVCGSNTASFPIQVILFHNVLVFIHGSPPDIKRHLFPSDIMSITETPGDKITLTYMTVYPYFVRVEEFRFQPKEPGSDTATWLQKLHIFAPNASRHIQTSQKILRIAKRHAQYEKNAPLTAQINNVSVAGLAALHATSIPNELNISVAILPEFESDGIATNLIAHTLELAFEKLDAHRVQARVVHSSTNPAQTVRAIRFLLHLGFTHEGVRRRSAIHPIERQWADVSVLAMLELDWVTRAVGTPAKGTLWDEMFVRHQREREVLLKMEGSKELKRTRSMETVRDLHSMNDGIPSASMVSPSVGCPTVASDTTSQVSVPTTTSSWDGMSDSTSLQSGAAKVLSAASLSSADDAADEYEEWDLEEDYSDEDEDEDHGDGLKQ